MKRAGQIFSAVCITLIIGFRLIQFFQPFEWQRKAAESIDYSAFVQEREIENQFSEISSGFNFPADFDTKLREATKEIDFSQLLEETSSE